LLLPLPVEKAESGRPKNSLKYFFSYCILAESIIKGFFKIIFWRREVKGMRKKLFVLSIGLIFALSLIGMALAQEKAKPPEPAKPAEVAQPAEAAKKEEAKKEAPPKPVMYRLGGMVMSVDAKAGKITIEQHQVKLQRKLTLKVSKKEVQELSGINVGDVVNAWVTGSTITKLVKVY
jgi:Cu/Ag efflux protein CusF